MPTLIIEKDDLLTFLKKNPYKKAYVVEDKSILLNLEFNSEINKIFAEVYVEGSDRVHTSQVEESFLNTANYWGDKRIIYTTLGMKSLLDSWDKKDRTK